MNPTLLLNQYCKPLLICMTAVTVLFSGCTAQQVDMATKVAGVANAVRAGGSTEAKTEAKSALGVLTPTSGQVKAVGKLMFKSTGDFAVNMLMPAVGTQISAVVLSLSCHESQSTSDLTTIVKRYTKATTGFTGALNGMTKAPKDRCADVVSISNAQTDGVNLSFNVLYQSPQSGESQTRSYTMQKSDTGWLFTKGS